MAELKFTRTEIDGLIVIDLPLNRDNRGWFKENFQRAKMVADASENGVGIIPDLKVVQNNISFNAQKGATRGIHAEPWNKFISVATGSVFGAWVDLRAGSATYGKVHTEIITPDKAIFLPRGVANAFQALEDNTAYTYLVDDHWSADASYTFVNLADPELAINWPIPLDSPEVEMSEKDEAHPLLKDVEPMLPKLTLVTGANGQLGKAVRDFVSTNFSEAIQSTYLWTDIDSFNFADPADYSKFNWSQVGTIINCGAYTAVDAAETEDGRKAAWKANATGPSLLAKTASEYGITLVHISSDYVFDGTQTEHYETEDFSPLGVYGQSKAAGDIAVATTPKHYILRTSWVIGDGGNFVRTFQNLAVKGVKPTVVDDQFGRLTFTDTLSAAIFHLLKNNCESGTYNCSNSGEVVSWCKIARQIYILAGSNPEDVSATSTEAYFADNASAGKPISPRPVNSALNLAKLEATGFTIPKWEDKLKEYMK